MDRKSKKRRSGGPGTAALDLSLARAVLDALPDHIYAKDCEGRYLLVNAQGLRERGLKSLAEIAGKTALELLAPEIGRRVAAEDRLVIESGEVLVNREARTRFGARSPDEERWHITSKIPLRGANGEVLGVVGINRDITERKRVEEALREREQMFRATFDQAAVGITLISLELRWLRVNDRFCEILGYSRDELLSMSLPEVNLPENIDPTVEFLRGLAAGRQSSGTVLREKELVRKDGHRVWVAIATSLVRGADGEAAYFVSVVEDISEAKDAAAALQESEERFRRLAQYDALTELPNRALFHDRLKQALALARRERLIVGVMFIDLDRFKQVNDTFGHAGGDELLRQVAARLSRSLRASDTVARLGGDEFAVVLGRLSQAGDASRVAEKILAAFQQPIEVQHSALLATLSIGMALYPGDSDDQETLLKHADAAMYRAKDAGRNCWRLFSEEGFSGSRP